MATKKYTHKKVGATRTEQRRHDKHRAGFEKAIRGMKNMARRKSNGGAGG